MVIVNETLGPLVLVVEDELQMARYMRTALIAHGYRVLEAGSGEEAIRRAVMQNPDLVLMDLGLPDMDGVQVIAQLRQWSTVPVIVISARDQESDRIEALDSGADDYLTKPFGTGELFARIRVAMRHRAAAADGEEPVVEVGDLRIDLANRTVTVREERIHLTRREYGLLATLAKNVGRVVTHRQLLKEVWGPQYLTETHYLRVYMAQLRHKLEVDPARPRYLETESGIGYRLKNE
jgi:two-component system KDP operon response regulator KdpE